MESVVVTDGLYHRLYRQAGAGLQVGGALQAQLLQMGLERGPGEAAHCGAEGGVAQAGAPRQLGEGRPSARRPAPTPAWCCA